MAQNPIVEVQVMHTFTEKEIDVISKQLANQIGEKENLEAEKKSVTAQYKADIDAVQTQIKKLATRINEGQESRMVPAEKVKNVEGKCWDFLDINTREIIKSTPFESKDFQGTQLSIDDTEEDNDGYKEPYNGPVFGDDDDDAESDSEEDGELVELDNDEPYATADDDSITDLEFDEVSYPDDEAQTEEPVFESDPEEEPQSLGAAIEDLKAAKKKATPRVKKS